MEKSGRKFYVDQIVELEKSSTSETGSSDAGVLSANVRAYFNELFGKIMENNQVREDRIMSHIEAMVKEAEEGWEKMKEETKVEMKVSEARVVAGVEIVKGVVEFIRSSTFFLLILHLFI